MTTSTTILPGLAELSQAAQDYAAAILGEYELTPTGRALLLEACRCIDTVEAARSERHQLVVDGRYKGTGRADPTWAVERAARQDLLRCIAALNLERS